jgi:hypothetical protein
MHPSSLDNMRKCYQRFIANTELEQRSSISVLDVGGADVNGSYRDLFRAPQFHYQAADLEPSEGVSIVLDDPYHLPLPDGSIDIVLSGQMLEHCEFFWLSFVEMARVLAPGGCLLLIAPSAGPIHRYPVDCYRFYPDAYHALAKYAGCKLVECWLDERGPWNDLVGVFAQGALPLKAINADAAPAPESWKTPNLVQMAEQIGQHLGALQVFYIAEDQQLASDQRGLTSERRLIVIGGRKSFERILNEFMEAERGANPSSAVLIWGVVPESEDRYDGWKIIEFLSTYRADLAICRIENSLLIWKLDATSRLLWERYNPLVAKAQRSGSHSKKAFDVAPAASLQSFNWHDVSTYLKSRQSVA